MINTGDQGGAKQPSAVDLSLHIKCPVYRCEARFLTPAELDNHYGEAHKDLVNLGISMGQDKDTGQLRGCIKDTLLTQVITFAICNKDSIRAFQSDFLEDEANGLRAEIRDLLKGEM